MTSADRHRQQRDFPAAHSMDATWFAVDDDGQVAVFDTDEGGSRPDQGFPVIDDGELLSRLLWSKAQSDDRLRALLPDTLRKLERKIDDCEAWELVPRLFRSLGVWFYDGPLGGAVPYVRGGSVPRPMLVDALDEDLRRQLEQARLPVRFRDSEVIAPGEFVPVHAWGCVWWDRDGHPHATKYKEKDFERLAGDIHKLKPHWQGQADAGPIFEGDSFYAAVEELLESIPSYGLELESDES